MKMDQKNRKDRWEDIICSYYEGKLDFGDKDELYYVFFNWLLKGDGTEQKRDILEQLWSEGKLGEGLNEEESRVYAEKLMKKFKESVDTLAAKEKRRERIVEVRDRRSGSLRRNTLRFVAVLLPALLVVSGFWMYNQISIKGREAQYVDLFAPIGDPQEIVTEDGSKIWLNSMGEAKYSDNDLGDRVVRLSGEACFFVAPYKNKRFIVKTEGLRVSVFGTEFNVEAYPEREHTVVSLFEGKVTVEDKVKNRWVLEPNQKLMYNNQSGEVEVVDINSEVAKLYDWRSGVLVIDNLTMEQAIKEIKRTFNYSFEIDPKLQFSNERYVLRFVKEDKLEYIISVLHSLEGGFEYEVIDGNRIVMSAISESK